MRDESQIREAIEIIEKSAAIMERGAHESAIPGMKNIIDALRYALGDPSRLAFTLVKAQEQICTVTRKQDESC